MEAEGFFLCEKAINMNKILKLNEIIQCFECVYLETIGHNIGSGELPTRFLPREFHSKAGFSLMVFKLDEQLR